MDSKSKYKVNLGGHFFGFDDGITAINFAEVAGNHFIPGEYVKNLDIAVYVKTKVFEDVKEENDNDND